MFGEKFSLLSKEIEAVSEEVNDWEILGYDAFFERDENFTTCVLIPKNTTIKGIPAVAELENIPYLSKYAMELITILVAGYGIDGAKEVLLEKGFSYIVAHL